MELRQYWKIIQRRWMWILLPALIVLALGLATYDPAPPAYNVGVRFIAAQKPGLEAAVSDEQRLFNWTTSEYIVNGLADWVGSGRFAESVSAYLATQGIEVPPSVIQGGLAADNARSMLTISLTSGDATLLADMMDGVIVVLTTLNAEALPQLGDEVAELVQLDDPIVNQIPGSIKNQLDLPLRLILALAVGFGMALLVEYLDPTVHERKDLDRLGLPVLAEIPKK